MIEIWGITFSSQVLFFLFIVFIGILMLVFYRNRKYNILFVQAVGKELEAALSPTDQTYTWLGGAVGFTAEYITEKPIRKVDATVTMLSRQSLLFYPVSKLFFGNDRLFVVLYPFDKSRREAHVLEKWYYNVRLRSLENEAALNRQEIAVNGKKFYLFSSDKAGLEKLSAWMHTFPAPQLMKHVALMPEQGTIYLYMVPKLGAVTASVQALKELISKETREKVR